MHLSVFQLQLHERGMKIHEFIYDQVQALFIWTKTHQDNGNHVIKTSSHRCHSMCLNHVSEG